MNHLAAICIALLILGCEVQPEPPKSVLTLSPRIDTSDATNQAIVAALTDFLATKNASAAENAHWLPADFESYTYPYLDIVHIEHSDGGDGVYSASLMELLHTANSNQTIVKLAFIGHDPKSHENRLKAIYNLLANNANGKIYFSRYLDYATQTWPTHSTADITYKISPGKTFNAAEATRQQYDIERICKFFDCTPLPITYYSCTNAKEVFEIKGFDYHPMMYISDTGGLADYGNLIFSGSNSEVYTHEVVHIYTLNLFPNLHRFLDEGIATYIGGSGQQSYTWHRDKLQRFLDENSDFDVSGHFDPYERLYFEEETPIPYTIGALIMERTLRMKGNSGLLSLLASENELWATLSIAGLTPENINSELRSELNRPATLPWPDAD
jgi:hypothetical protein